VLQLLVVDDHPILRDAVVASLQRQYPQAVLTQADSLHACLQHLQAGLDPDLILFDLNLGDHQGVSGLQIVRQQVPDTPILIISAEQDKQVILNCLSAGAAGFVLKSQPSQALMEAVDLVLAGKIYFPDLSQCSNSSADQTLWSKDQLKQLTNKQLQVLSLIAEGCANKEICLRLCIAETTVKTHVSDILRKLGVKNRTQAALALDKDLLQELLVH